MQKFLRVLKYLFLFLGAALLIAAVSCSGTRTLMQTAPSTVKGQPASPLINAATIDQWDAQKPAIKRTFEQEVYGVMPKRSDTQKTNSKTILNHSYKAVIEEINLTTQYEASNAAERVTSYTAIILTPKNTDGPVPVIMMENFCPNHNVVPAEGIALPQANNSFDCGGDGIMASLLGYFFGRYITTPPIDMIMERGYALAVIYPSDVFPDNAELYAPTAKSSPSNEYPMGAVGAWAFQFSSLANHLETDTRFSQIVTFGHSRYGKSALLAAAFDPTIDGVIAHQSGTGGASLSRDKAGETVAQITNAYPHWFAKTYNENTLTLDQHHLLALIAPRPILLGNAKRDVWSDPEGAFRSASAANPIYELYGSRGLTTTKLTEFNPAADIAFWMRPGTHGVVKEDWPAFLAFMDAHFKDIKSDKN